MKRRCIGVLATIDIRDKLPEALIERDTKQQEETMVDAGWAHHLTSTVDPSP